MVVVEVDIAGVEAVEVEELGVGQEVQVALPETQVAGEFVGGWDGIEVGDVLRHVRRPPAMVGRHAVLFARRRSREREW